MRLTAHLRSAFGYGRKKSRKGAKIAKMEENEIGKEIINAAIAVHRELGPGLLETVYEVVLNEEFLGDLSGAQTMVFLKSYHKNRHRV